MLENATQPNPTHGWTQPMSISATDPVAGGEGAGCHYTPPPLSVLYLGLGLRPFGLRLWPEIGGLAPSQHDGLDQTTPRTVRTCAIVIRITASAETVCYLSDLAIWLKKLNLLSRRSISLAIRCVPLRLRFPSALYSSAVNCI